MSKQISDLKNVRDIQGYGGNWDYDEYMWGMYNGLELALAIMEDREPVYKDKPKKFSNVPDPVIDNRFRDKLKLGWRKN